MCIFLKGQLTVYFEKPFWVGVFERVENDKLQVCKMTFYTEPKDYEVYEYVHEHYSKLTFSSPVENQLEVTKKINPKRLHRQIRQLTKENGVGTKSQEAIQRQREELKEERRKMTKQEKEERKRDLFRQKQEKKKQKKRGH
jgi:hypothetical protein